MTESKTKTTTPPRYFVLAAVLFTSSSSIFIRLSAMPPLVIAFYRMVFAAAFLALPFVLRKYRAQLVSVTRRDLLLCGVSGVALAAHFATWIASLSLTTVMASTVLVSCSPFFVALINAAVFRKKPGKTLLLCLAVAFAGTLVITTGTGNGFGSLAGNLLALAGAATVSIYLIIGQEVRKRVTTAPYAFLVYTAAALALLALNVASSQPLAPHSAVDFGIVAAMAIVCSVGGHTLYNMLLRFHGAFLVSLATLCEPLFASLLAAIILSEIPQLQTIAGGALVIAGLAGYIGNANKQKTPSSSS